MNLHLAHMKNKSYQRLLHLVVLGGVSFYFRYMLLQAKSGILYSAGFDQDTCTRESVKLSVLITIWSIQKIDY